MPGNIQGLTTVGPNISKRADRWLNFNYAFPPERDIRDREDSPGSRNPYNRWFDGDCIGDETTGVSIQKSKVYDDDVRLGGTKAASYVIQGQCFDAGGNPVPGATVELWLSTPAYADAHQPLLVGTTVANANGIYGFAVNDTTTKYYVVAYVTGKGGVTARDLVGA